MPAGRRKRGYDSAVGKLTYEGNVKVDVEDRALAHLQVVIGNKLRRGESFYFSWADQASTGGGRTSIWIHPRCSLTFKYFGSKAPQLNPAWIDALSFVANSPSGLRVVPETTEPPVEELVG